MARGAGQLDRRITIQRYTATQDAFGGDTKTWVNLTTNSQEGGPEKFAAKYTPVSDAERLSASQINATQMSRFVVRSSTVTRGVTPEDRVSFDGDFWDIHGIKETKEGRKRFLEITAMREAD